ncbi:CP family cyanate transporter-like MFS transporter [Arthrobacter sp. 1088]|uniref:MFS transporter n=1 Tax=Arthrobacter sp. 1088 TaxID=2817768 RepID=UPI00285A91A5|nr:MFS transporter [Arthrobacter sp. 1088]MDR6685322.1 CP family cyanate transporter-like MFS transporter [Arthrobacter sp. 1088]
MGALKGKEAEKRPLRGRVTALAGVLLVAFSAREAVSAVSPLLGHISADLPFDAVTTGILGMLPTAGFAMMGFFALPLVRQFQMEHLLLVAILLTTSGQVGRALGWNVVAFLVFTCIAMLGIGLVNVVAPPLLMEYFPDRIGVLAALHISLLGASTAMAAQFAIPLGNLYGWRFSIGIWAALSALAAIPWLILPGAKRNLARSRTSPADDRPLPPANAIKPWRSSIGWGTAMIFAGCSSNTFAALTWLPAVLVDRGTGPDAAGSMLALYSILALPVALVAPVVVVRMPRPLPVAILFVLAFAVGYAGIILAPPASAAVWVVIAGLGQGAYAFAFTMINKRTRTQSGSGSLSAFAQGTGYAFASVGPFLFALLHSPGDGWLPSFGMLGAWLVVLVAGAIMVNKPRMLDKGP